MSDAKSRASIPRGRIRACYKVNTCPDEQFSPVRDDKVGSRNRRRIEMQQRHVSLGVHPWPPIYFSTPSAALQPSSGSLGALSSARISGPSPNTSPQPWELPPPLLVISANKAFEQRASEMNVSHPRGIGKERRDPIYAQLWQICWSRGRR